MVSNVTTCHAAAPEPPVPAALAQRYALAVSASAADTLLASHPYGAAVVLAAGATSAKKAASPKKPSSTGIGYAGGAASATSKTTPAKTSTPAALAFLDDKNLSVEDKLLKLLAYLDKKWESDIDKKMKEVADITKSSGSGSSSSSGGGASGLLGSVVGMAKSFAGPALAAGVTALGMPALAPVALQLGPAIVDAGSR
ncbi:MAG TPA: hypothetical protein VF875_15825, partial [Anaeromyxobacter sp.]